MGSDLTPPKSRKAVFRAEAVEQYVRTREEVILPRFVSKRTIVLLWAGLAAIILGAVALLTVNVPVYISGTAAPAPRASTLQVYVPAEALARVRPGYPAYIHRDGGGRRFAGRVIAGAESQASSGAGVRRAAPSREGGERSTGVVLVRLAAGAPACRPPRCRVDIRIGTPTALALFGLVEFGTAE